MNRILKWCLFVLFGLVLLLAVAIPILNVTLKNYIEKNGETWIGRKILVDKIRVNLFNGSASVYGLVVKEQDGTTDFFNLDQLYVNSSPYKLLGDQLYISSVDIVGPKVHIYSNQGRFNFDDITAKLQQGDTISEEEPSSFKIRIQEAALSKGSVTFKDNTFASAFALDSIFLKLPLYDTEVDTIALEAGLLMGAGGSTQIQGLINQQTKDYHAHMQTAGLHLSPLLPYAEKFMYVSKIEGTVDTDLFLSGNVDATGLRANGSLGINDFGFYDLKGKRIMELGAAQAKIDSVDTFTGVYNIQEFLVTDPGLHLEITAEGNNIVRNFVSSDSIPDAAGNEVAIAQASTVDSQYMDFFNLLTGYLASLGQHYEMKNYHLGHFLLEGGEVTIMDETLNEIFNFIFEDLNVRMDDADYQKEHIDIAINSILNYSGKFKANMKVNTHNFKNVSFDYVIEDLKISDFSPYSDYYVAHRFLEGVVKAENKTSIQDNQLKSANHFFVDNIQVSKKTHENSEVDLPLRLAVSLLRDVNGDIDLDLPIEGDVSDPKFKLWPIVWTVVKNSLTKVVAAPFKALGGVVGADPESIQAIRYGYGQVKIEEQQEKTIGQLAKILEKKPEFGLELTHFFNPEWEVQQLALYMAKADFYSDTHSKPRGSFTAQDSMAVDGIAIKDSTFVAFLREKSQNFDPNADVLDLSLAQVDQDSLRAQEEERAQDRTAILRQYLNTHLVDTTVYKIKEAKGEDLERFRSSPKYEVSFPLMDSLPAVDKPVSPLDSINQK